MKANVSKPRRVALVVRQNCTFGRRIVQGVIAFTGKHPHWDLFVYNGEPNLPWESVQGWKGEGIIADAFFEKEAKILRATGIPVVNVTAAKFNPPLPTVTDDNQQIGKVAAEHLLNKGIERFAFAGISPATHDRQRFEGFKLGLHRSGFGCDSFFYDTRGDTSAPTCEGSLYLKFLEKLKYPVGIMGSNDRVAFGILEACRLLRLRCPDQVAVIGCDSDETLCPLGYATISSVNPRTNDIGFKAAALLESLMLGQAPKMTEYLVPPEGVEMRNSTDLLNVKDLDVAESLRYMRNNAGEFIDVGDILRIVPASRRALERKFVEAIGHGIYEEIHRIHIERAKQLLEETDLSLTRIALASGYHGISRFQANFLKVVGVSAAEYRRRLPNTPKKLQQISTSIVD